MNEQNILDDFDADLDMESHHSTHIGSEPGKRITNYSEVEDKSVLFV
jgi:hypothetical protein